MWLLLTTAAAASEPGGFLNFDYVHHGEDWQYGSCSARERQSPVDFPSSAPWQDLPRKQFYFDYATATEFQYQNNGHGVAADVGGMGIGGIVYDLDLPSSAGFYNLLSVNFHAQSEHTFRGERLPLELHLVHKLAGGSALLVVAVPVRVGAAGLLEAFADAPHAYHRNLRRNTTDFNRMLQGGTYFRYEGSLTVPPCEEIATWMVRREPLSASEAVVASITNAILSGTSGFGNFRAALPLGDREVDVLSAVRGKPPVPAGPAEPIKEQGEVFSGQSAALRAAEATRKANEAVHYLDAKLVRASRAHLAVMGELGPEAPQAQVAAEAAKVAEGTLRSIAEEIGRQVKDHLRR